MYGETLPPQDGAPVRLIVPWKYGFKSIKSIVKISLVGGMPPTILEHGESARVRLLLQRESRAWTIRAGARQRSGGWANSARRPTLMFNGYGDQVASLYTGMDLKKNY